MKILLLSDTHSYIDDRILEYAKNADEIWHAGDFGNLEVIDDLKKAILTEFNLGKRSGFQHDGELGLGRPFISQFVVPGHRSPSVFGVFSPIIQSDFADVFLPS